MHKVKNSDLIIAEAKSWLGTPYKDRHRTKGHGVDCAGLVYMVGKNVGAVVDKEMEMYSPEPTENKMTNTLNCKGVKLLEMKIGCVVTIKIHKYPQHLGIIISPTQFIHANSSGDSRLNQVITQRISPRLRISGYYTYTWP